MAQGRTVLKHSRAYADGYDLSGYTRSFGPLVWEYDVEEDAALTDGVKGGLPNHAIHGIGAINGFFDNTQTSGLHVVMNGAGVSRTIMLPVGIQAAPAAGDPVYVGRFVQTGYMAEGANVNIPFGAAFTGSAIVGKYSKPWGVLLHAQASRNAVNSSAGIDDNGAATAFGGYMAYQIFSITGTGTATVKVQDAAANADGSFADLSGATSGAIATASAPVAGMVALGVAATVRRYLRWQIVFGGSATACVFSLAFVRSTVPGV